MEWKNYSDQAILEEIGRRLRRERLNRNLTQEALAKESGVGRRTLQNAEDGDGVTLATLVALLRGLDLLNHLDHFLPEPPPSPVQLAKLRGRTRRRASGKHQSDRPASDWQWEE